ncbi:hypothetical protein BGZ67_004371 [Mortierella alpina]|nr:hypothetical protein BGZ67_004371 [Mortierella alpina]
MHPAADNENESGNETPGYDLSMDHPGYSLPLTNISYSVDHRERQHVRCEAMAQKAFQNIMDSYEEYERMTDVFQLEHERREQHERELKEERLRLRKQQKSKKKTGKQDSSAPVPASATSSSSTTPSKAVTPLAVCAPISTFSPSPWSPAAQQGRPHKKRKQYIPVHPAIVNRIPGITLRIQPDTTQGHQHLQVEILKNVDDYPSSHHGYNVSEKDTADVDSIASPLTPLSDESVDLRPPKQSQLQARHDLSRIQKSIESGWPSYSYFPHSYLGPVKCEHAYYQQYPQDDKDVEMHDVAVAPNTLRSLGMTKHKRHQSTDSTIRRKSMHRSQENSPSVSGSRSVWPQDVAIAIADLPLSWNNFASRDCQVNTVIGKHDKEFGLLEDVVQEAVARQQAAQQLVSEDESEDESQDVHEPIVNGDQKSRRSSHTQDREGSATSASTPRANRTRTPNKPAASRSSATETARARATRSQTHPHDHDSGTAELVEAYDDIDRAMKAKRQKKREERMRATSEATSSASVAAEEDQEAEDGGFEGRDISDEYINMERVQDEGQTQPPSRFKKPPALHFASGEAQDRSSKIKEDTVASPPSPPNSRQVTPAKGESTASSRRPSISSHARTNKTHSRTTSISNDAASTPPATPTKSTYTNSPDQRTGYGDRDGSEPSAKLSASGRTRASGRSLSNVIPAEGGTNYFESAMHMIEAKRRQAIAKKRAAAATTENESSSSGPVDPHELERELEHHLSASEESRVEPSGMKEDVRSAGSNLPKSSRALPGRVLRRVADHDREGRSVDSEPLLDPDCTSCRLELTAKDKATWRQAIQDGEIHLNRRTWSKTAILCNVCRVQYQEHHLRCTQCFFVPVASAIKTLKPGGTCIRCKAGTWLIEI